MMDEKELNKTEPENLLLQHETELPEVGLVNHDTHSSSGFDVDSNTGLRETEAPINLLERESSPGQQKFDNIVKLATDQDMHAKERLEELELLEKVEDIIHEVQSSKEVIMDVMSLKDEIFAAMSNVFVDIRPLLCQISVEQNLVIKDWEKMYFFVRQKITELENERIVLHNQARDAQKEMENQRLDAQRSEESMKAFSEQQNLEKDDLLSYIEILKREISSTSSGSLAWEKESMRKDLEKVRTKLKETDSKLKNVLQEKTKIEGEKAYAERELKRLQGQTTLLERDISKRDLLAGRICDSFMDSSSKVLDRKKARGPEVPCEEAMQEGYRELEVLAFHMERHIASLEDNLTSMKRENEEVNSRNGILSENLIISNSERNLLHEEISHLESSMKSLIEEKDNLAMQLTDSLLKMEEVRAIWYAKETAPIEAIEEKADNLSIKRLSAELSEEDYRKLEVLAFKMERHIASLEDNLTSVIRENEAVNSRNGCLSEKLIISNSELNLLLEKISHLRLKLEESKFKHESMETSMMSLIKEKENLAMQLTDSLLEMEEEKAIWSAREKASIEAIQEKAKLHDVNIKSLYAELSEVRNAFDCCKEECKILKERLTCSEETATLEKKINEESLLEIERLKNELKKADAESFESHEVLCFQLHQSREEADRLENELSLLTKERESLLALIIKLDIGRDSANDIASLEENLTSMKKENEEVNSRNERLSSELETLSEKLITSHSELNLLHEEISLLRLKLQESKSEQESTEKSMKLWREEKEKLAMQLTDSLLELEEEKAMWSAKEKASTEIIEETANRYNMDIKSLSAEMSEVSNALDCCKEECKVLKERLSRSEDTAASEKKISNESLLEIDRLKNELKKADAQSCQSHKELSFQLHQSREEADRLENELSLLNKERESLLGRIRELVDIGRESANDIQSLQNQLVFMTKERDRLVNQIGELHRIVAETEATHQNCNKMLLEAQAQVEEQRSRISSLESKLQINHLEVQTQVTKPSLDTLRKRGGPVTRSRAKSLKQGRS